MKAASIFFICLLSAQILAAQNSFGEIAVNDILAIETPMSGSTFNHIYFPKKNFIIKKRGVANYKSIYGCVVMVSSIEKQVDGTTRVSLRRKDGRKFFNYLAEVKASLEPALERGELRLLEP